MFNKQSRQRAEHNLGSKEIHTEDEQFESFNNRQFQLPEKFFDKVLEIERQIDEMQQNTPHDLL